MVIGALLASAGTMAQASDKPLYQPAPDWVKPAPPIDPATVTDASPVLLMLDQQQRLQDGEVWSYADTATRVASSEVLGQVGTVTLPWQPAKGDLIVHRLEIIRGTEHIDLLAGGKAFAVIRREQQLEQRQLDGLLTATMPVEGLRVGDILHLTVSTTTKDAALKGQVQSYTPLPALPFRVAFARTRSLWPRTAAVKWKSLADGVHPVEADVGSYHDLTVTLPLAKQPDMPSDAPARFAKLQLLELSSFPNWASVAAVMAPLYATDGLIAPGSPLAAEVARIRAAETDPLRRTALALQLVQDKVRYLFNGMDQGNYVPQTPAQTWTLRYGDCKAKTVLLLALLHALDIDAEPALANSKLGGLLPERLPAPGAFDHVLVKATVAGEILWLDGTDNGTLLADLHDTPPFRYVLPLEAKGATLYPIAIRAAARPEVDTLITYDERAGVLLPAPMTISVTVRGRTAQVIKAAKAQASKDDIDKMVDGIADKFVPSATIVARAVSVDDATGTAVLTASGVAYPDWNRIDERYKSTIDGTVSKIDFNPDRARSAWAAIPVATGDGGHYRQRTRIQLPDGGKDFVLEGDQTIATPIAGTTITRTVTRDGGWLTIDDRSIATGEEITPAALAAARQRVSAARGHMLTAVAPAAYPGLYRQIETARRAKAFDPTLALYSRAVADKPDEATSYTNRAWFLDRIYDRKQAIADLTKAIAIKPDLSTYQWRARLLQSMGDKPGALADLKAARDLDPGDDDTVWQLATLEADQGAKDDALGIVQERIDAGGKNKPQMLALKADVLARFGDKDAALSTIDAAVAASPGNANLLNQRCWLKGTLNIALDTALKDCTRSIELSDSSTAALDSRAMIYFRLNRMDEAMSDLEAALDDAPDAAGSLYMRGVIRGRQGKPDAKDDLAAARTIRPRIDEDYSRWGIKP